MKIIRQISVILLLCFITPAVSYAQTEPDIVAAYLKKTSIKTEADSIFSFKLIANIQFGYHINSNKPNDSFLIPVTVTLGSNHFKLIRVNFPQPVELHLFVSKKPISAYTGKIIVALSVKAGKNIKPGKYSLQVNLNYQGCTDKSCFPPATLKNDLNVTIIKAKKMLVGQTNIESQTRSIIHKREEKVKIAINKKEISGSKPDLTDTLRSTDTTTADIILPSNINNGLKEADLSLFLAIIFAFIGGMILNLMPCVLPVLSLKIMGFIEQSGEDKSKTRKHGAAFTFGVLVSFWVLAGLLIALRAGGESLGWGFQLQSPGFIIVISILLFLFGLSMFGVFEIGTRLTATGQNLKSTGYLGSFTSGVLATVVATPCTAPFMGSALGYALSQPVYVSLFVFTFMGLGMALPYVLLTNTPKLLKFVPKPGAWMESLKQFMGFLLMATVLWLIWVLSKQTGNEGVLFLLISIIIASLGAWIFGRWGNIARKLKTRRIAQILSAIIIISSLVFSMENIKAGTTATANIAKQGMISWQKYSPEKIEKDRKDGKMVFVDFTAAWCLTCQANEKVAFGSKTVQEDFVKNKIAAFRGDWTNSNPVITKALARFGRSSVPLYVLYKPGNKPIVLPQILTPDIVLNAIGKTD